MNDPEDKFAAVYAQHQSLVRRVVRHLGVPADGVDDVAQEVWMTVHRRLPHLDVTRPLAPWLTAVAGNIIHRGRRGFARALRKSQALRALEDASPSTSPAPDARLDAIHTVKELLADLPDAQRIVLLLCDGEGMTEPEVANSLGIPVNTVSSRRRLAHRRCLARAGVLDLSVLLLLLGKYRAALEADSVPFATLSSLQTARRSGPAPIAACVAVPFLAFVAALRMLASPVERVEPMALPGGTLLHSMRAITPAFVPPDVEKQLRNPPPPPPPPSSRKPPPRIGRLPSSLAAELRLIEAAQYALDHGEFGRARRLLAEHRSDFPRGPTAVLRDAALVRVYCAIGNFAQADTIVSRRRHSPEYKEFARDSCVREPSRGK